MMTSETPSRLCAPTLLSHLQYGAPRNTQKRRSRSHAGMHAAWNGWIQGSTFPFPAREPARKNQRLQKGRTVGKEGGLTSGSSEFQPPATPSSYPPPQHPPPDSSKPPPRASLFQRQARRGRVGRAVHVQFQPRGSCPALPRGPGLLRLGAPRSLASPSSEPRVAPQSGGP